MLLVFLSDESQFLISHFPQLKQSKVIKEILLEIGFIEEIRNI